MVKPRVLGASESSRIKVTPGLLDALTRTDGKKKALWTPTREARPAARSSRARSPPAPRPHRRRVGRDHARQP